MSTYQVDTDGGSYQIETEDHAPLNPETVGGPKGSFPEPQVSDNPAAGAEKPIEQRLAENALTVGNAAALPMGLAGLGEAGTGLLNKSMAGVPEEGGLLGTVGQYAKRFGQNQAIKALGASGGQIGQVGVPESRALAQSMIDKGVISPLRGPIGLEEKVAQLHGQAGQALGGARKAADVTGHAPSMAEILQQVQKDLESTYASGANKGMAGLNRAKEEIAKGGTGTFVGNAQKATDLNQAAAANKLYRPQGATTDVADTISRLNNEAMGKTLSPEQMTKYDLAKKDYGDLDKVQKFLERGERKEMAGRGGASLAKTIADKTMDAIGNRTAATLGSKTGDLLQSPALNDPLVQKGLMSYLLSKNEDQDKNK